MQNCTWRSGTCFGTSTDLIFAQMIFLIFFFHFYFEVRAGNIVTETLGAQKSGGYPLAADHRPREVLAACPKIRLPFPRGRPKRLVEPNHFAARGPFQQNWAQLLHGQANRLVERGELPLGESLLTALPTTPTFSQSSPRRISRQLQRCLGRLKKPIDKPS